MTDYEFNPDHEFKPGDKVVDGFVGGVYEVLFVGEWWSVLRSPGGEHPVKTVTLRDLYRPAPAPGFVEGETYAMNGGSRFRVYEVDQDYAYGVTTLPSGNKAVSRLRHDNFHDLVRS